jgi:hypothetical protein
MTGDWCQPEKLIHRCIRTHSHMYSHIDSPVKIFKRRLSRSIISIGEYVTSLRIAYVCEGGFLKQVYFPVRTNSTSRSVFRKWPAALIASFVVP